MLSSLSSVVVITKKLAPRKLTLIDAKNYFGPHPFIAVRAPRKKYLEFTAPNHSRDKTSQQDNGFTVEAQKRSNPELGLGA